MLKAVIWFCLFIHGYCKPFRVWTNNEWPTYRNIDDGASLMRPVHRDTQLRSIIPLAADIRYANNPSIVTSDHSYVKRQINTEILQCNPSDTLNPIPRENPEIITTIQGNGQPYVTAEAAPPPPMVVQYSQPTAQPSYQSASPSYQSASPVILPNYEQTTQPQLQPQPQPQPQSVVVQQSPPIYAAPPPNQPPCVVVNSPCSTPPCNPLVVPCSTPPCNPQSTTTTFNIPCNPPCTPPPQASFHTSDSDTTYVENENHDHRHSHEYPCIHKHHHYFHHHYDNDGHHHNHHEVHHDHGFAHQHEQDDGHPNDGYDNHVHQVHHDQTVIHHDHEFAHQHEHDGGHPNDGYDNHSDDQECNHYPDFAPQGGNMHEDFRQHNDVGEHEHDCYNRGNNHNEQPCSQRDNESLEQHHVRCWSPEKTAEYNKWLTDCIQKTDDGTNTKNLHGDDNEDNDENNNENNENENNNE